jgi:hypothetical protein
MPVSERVSRKAQTKAWSDNIDPATIPVEVLISQLERVPYDAILSLRGRKKCSQAEDIHGRNLLGGTQSEYQTVPVPKMHGEKTTRTAEEAAARQKLTIN